VAVVAERFTGFILLPLLTAGLDKRDFGAWSQIQAAYGLFSTALLLGFFHTVSGLIAGRSPRDAGRVYSGVLLIVLFSTTVLSALLLLAPDVASRLLFGDASYGYVLGAVAWFVSTECFYELAVLAFLRAEGRIAVASALHAAKGLLRLLAVWYGLGGREPLVAILLILGAINCVMVLAALIRYILPRGVGAPTALGSAFWRISLVAAVSVAATVLLGWANLSINRFLIVHFEGLTDVAMYSANYSILSIVLLVPMILTFTLLHHVSATLVAGALDQARRLIDRAVHYYIYATLPLLALVATLYHPLVSLLARGYDAGFVLPATLIAYFFAFGLEQLLVFATFPGGGTPALRARGLALGLNVVGGLVLIPAFGVTVAAVPPLVGSLAILAMCGATLRTRLGYRFPWGALVGTSGPALLMAAAGWLVVTGFDVRSWWALALASLFLGLVYLAAESLRPSSLTRQLLADLTDFARLAGSQG
jgi:O-antigen/teichoic acid export membrane protein